MNYKTNSFAIYFYFLNKTLFIIVQLQDNDKKAKYIKKKKIIQISISVKLRVGSGTGKTFRVPDTDTYNVPDTF